MSRIGKSPIAIPEGVDVKVENHTVTVKGPKGTLTNEFLKDVDIKVEDDKVLVTLVNEKAGNIHGLTRTLIHNMITGVTSGFEKALEINGIGYRAQKQGNNLNLTLGYSHPVIFEAPEGITFDVPNPNTIIVKGIDKELVGQTAANIRTKRPPEVYRGKGIKYAEEVIRRKEGKTGK